MKRLVLALAALATLAIIVWTKESGAGVATKSIARPRAVEASVARPTATSDSMRHAKPDAPPVTLARCAAIASSTERLSCYDAATRRPSLGRTRVASHPADAGHGQWIETKTKSPMYDAEDVAIELAANETIQGLGEHVRPVLVIRCARGTNLYIAWQTYLGLDTTTVTTRIDHAAPVVQTWDVGTDNTASFAPDPRWFIKQLLGRKRLVAQVVPYDANPALVTFDLTGIDRAIVPVRKACGW